MSELSNCPRCSGTPATKIIYGVHVIQCSTLDCGSVLTGQSVEEAAKKWNGRSPEASELQCPHCAGELTPYELCKASIPTNGFKCFSCGCTTGGWDAKHALQITTRRLAI